MPAPPRATSQRPSFDLSRSLTACGLALPPDDFITWPTNQPEAAGLAFACVDLVGIGGDDVVDHLSIALQVGDLLHAARSTSVRAGSPPSLPDDIRRRVLAESGRDGILANCDHDGSKLAAADTRDCPICSSLPYSAGPNSSLITQLAASLASARPRLVSATTFQNKQQSHVRRPTRWRRRARGRTRATKRVFFWSGNSGSFAFSSAT